MIVSLIVASTENGVIGKDNHLPWRLSADLKNFKRLTTGHPIIMGRKTFESIGRPLPKRRNIVVTRNPEYHAKGVEIAHSLLDALKMCEVEEEVFIIGGAQVYRKSFDLGLVNKIYHTKVHAELNGDAFFEIPDPEKWIMLSKSEYAADEKNEYSFTILEMERNGKMGTM